MADILPLHTRARGSFSRRKCLPDDVHILGCVFIFNGIDERNPNGQDEKFRSVTAAFTPKYSQI